VHFTISAYYFLGSVIFLNNTEFVWTAVLLMHWIS